jgi:hypothetical protein
MAKSNRTATTSVTLGQAVSMLEALEFARNQPVKGRVAVSLGRCVEALLPLFQDFEARRSASVLSFGDVNDSGETEVTPERKAEWLKMMGRVAEVRRNVILPKIKLSDLEDIKLTPGHALNLLPIIKGE